MARTHRSTPDAIVPLELRRRSPWWASATVYQIFPASFRDASGDGVGDLRGVIEKLDHLEALGVDALWLSPFYRSPMVDGGYDVEDYHRVEPRLGRLEDVDELAAGLHARGMRLIIDIVLNHTSDRHRWFRASRRDPSGPRRSWYWWRPPRPGKEPGAPGAEPTNWRSYFGGPAWTFDPASETYYLHLFHAGQPDLNWEAPELRSAVYATLRWWLDRGVDGFRFDTASVISKTLPLRDAQELGTDGLANGSPLYECGPRLHEFLHELHDRVIAPRRREIVTVGEMLGVTAEEACDVSDPAREELDMVFLFDHIVLDQTPRDRFHVRPVPLPELKRTLAHAQRAMGARGWSSLYWNDHDQPRSVSRFGDDDPAWRERSAMALATVMHLQRGTPFVFQGEELGIPNAGFDDLGDVRDVESLSYVPVARKLGVPDAEIVERIRAKSRDNARTPIPWTDGPNGGFTSGTPWLRLAPHHERTNARTQRADPGSVFHHYRRLIALRKALPALVWGDFEQLAEAHARLYAFVRRLDDETVWVVANFSREPLDVRDAGVRIPHDARAVLVSGGTPLERRTARPDDGSQAARPAVAPATPLAGWEARVYHHAGGRT